jgi:hypothetical protein
MEGAGAGVPRAAAYVLAAEKNTGDKGAVPISHQPVCYVGILGLKTRMPYYAQ